MTVFSGGEDILFHISRILQLLRDRWLQGAQLRRLSLHGAARRYISGPDNTSISSAHTIIGNVRVLIFCSSWAKIAAHSFDGTAETERVTEREGRKRIMFYETLGYCFRYPLSFRCTQNAIHLRIHLVPDDYGLRSRRALRQRTCSRINGD